MQTQCPHCETRFRITEIQISIADGLVRCGVCTEVFNAYEFASQQDYQPSLLNGEILPEQESVINISRTAFTDTDQHHDNSISDDNEIQVDNQSLNFVELDTAEESSKEPFDSLNEPRNESLAYVVPESLRDAQSRSMFSTLLWSAGILFFTATLFIEYVWFNRDQFNHVPELQAWTEKLCQHIQCKSISMRDPSKIELITRNVYSHPNEKNALMVNLTMKNNADFAQPYPVMQIDFSDIRGGTVAARRFLPAEYLPIEFQQAEAKQSRMLPANTSSSITMEIQDPGKQAMTYEFNFL
jgi:predicted Zn finger-like uncharacterized protein